MHPSTNPVKIGELNDRERFHSVKLNIQSMTIIKS